jgi:hypothetical protein
MGIVWQSKPTEVFPKMVRDYEQILMAACYQLLVAKAPGVQNWMKAHAPWRDRTANARQSIYARAYRGPHSATLEFGHLMPYSIYLEVKNAGAYAIVAPTVDHFAPEIVNDVKVMLRP